MLAPQPGTQVTGAKEQLFYSLQGLPQAVPQTGGLEALELGWMEAGLFCSSRYQEGVSLQRPWVQCLPLFLKPDSSQDPW